MEYPRPRRGGGGQELERLCRTRVMKPLKRPAKNTLAPDLLPVLAWPDKTL